MVHNLSPTCQFQSKFALNIFPMYTSFENVCFQLISCLPCNMKYFLEMIQSNYQSKRNESWSTLWTPHVNQSLEKGRSGIKKSIREGGISPWPTMRILFDDISFCNYRVFQNIVEISLCIFLTILDDIYLISTRTEIPSACIKSAYWWSYFKIQVAQKVKIYPP